MSYMPWGEFVIHALFFAGIGIIVLVGVAAIITRLDKILHEIKEEELEEDLRNLPF